MRLAPAVILLGTPCVAALAGCGTPDNAAAPDQAAAVPAPHEPAPTPPAAAMNEDCELALFYGQQLDGLLSRFAEDHPEVALTRRLAESAAAACASTAANAGPRSGDWVEKDGVLTCDGFMTRRDDQDYCSPVLPEDWVPFEYDGEIYFLQPLRGDAAPGSAARAPAPSESK